MSGDPTGAGGRALGPSPAPRFRARFLGPRHWPAWALMALLLLLGALPRRARDPLADAAGALYYRLNAKRRGYALTNLGLCFPHASEGERQRMARRHFQAQVGALLDIPLVCVAGRRRMRRLVEIDGIEHLRAARRDGRGAILLTCHTSALDVGGIALSLDEPIVSVFNPFKSELADWLMFRSRTRFGLRLARRADGLRPLVRAVRSGRDLYYIPDEDLGPGRTVFADFFGQPKASVAVLGRLARACDAAVVPCYSWYDRDARRYRAQLLPALAASAGGGDAHQARLMNAALERLIGLCPEQYMWTLRLFKTQPNGGPSPYAAFE